MFASIRPLAFTLAAGMILPAAASAVTFELNDDGIGDGSITGVGTPVVTGTQGTGSDLLTLTLGASSVGGTTVTGIKEGGGGGQSGLGIDISGGFSSNSGNEAEYESSNAAPDTNIIIETFLLSFSDAAGNPVAVNFLSAEISRLAGTNESVLVDIDGSLTTILGTASNGNQGAFTTTFAGSPLLAAGSQASFAPGVGTAFRLHSVTVDVVPEPASLALVGAGLALLAGRRRA